MKNINSYALITGAAGLLGEQHSLALAEIGYNLILVDIKLNKLKILKKQILKKKKNLKVLIFKIDVSNQKSVLNLSKKIVNRKIYLKVLVNNAAIDSKFKSNTLKGSSKFENTNLKDWKKHINVGLTGAMICSKFFGKILSKNRNGGIILNIASDLSVIAPNHSIYGKDQFKPIMYSVVKHGLIGLTKYIATYWHNKNVRCNALSPGPVLDNQSRLFINKLKKMIPLNRLANIDEYNEAIKFLCSDSSKYMTGQNIIIDGGRSIW